MKPIKWLTNKGNEYLLKKKLQVLDPYMKYRYEVELEDGYYKFKVTYYIKAKTYNIVSKDVNVIYNIIKERINHGKYI